MIRRPPRSTLDRSSAASDVYKRQVEGLALGDVLVQNFGSSRDVLIRVPLRGDIKKEDLVARVFGELCKAEGGSVVAKEAAADQSQTAARQVCAAGTACLLYTSP